jgi:glycosyltransferase involved in cell wall biosynthesis
MFPKTLTLVSPNIAQPDRNALIQLEKEDKHPRASLFATRLNADLLDERYLAQAPPFLRAVYGKVPTKIAQVCEAYRVRNDYDAVISWAEDLGMLFAGMMKGTFVRTPHVAIWSWISREKKARILKTVHSHVDKIVLMSSRQRDFALHELGLPSSKIIGSRWPVDTKFWRPLPQPTDMICSVGREMRDYATLVRATRDLPIPCHIAAGGSMTALKKDQWITDLEQEGELPPHITIGKKTYAELRALYARSRFLVMPMFQTETDNGSTSILEAMAMGIPTICSRTIGQVDIIEDGKTGIFVPVGDTRALREAILYLWNHPEEAQRMGAAGREFVLKHHDLENFIDAIGTAVTEAIAAHKRK